MTIRLAPVLLLAAVAFGCAAKHPGTDSARSAVEQLLLTTSVDRAVASLALPDLRDRAVAVELVTLGRGEEFYDDPPYLGSRLELRLAADGARVVERAAAERVVRVYVEALGTRRTERFVGIPKYLPLFQAERRQGIARIRIVVYDGGGNLLEGGPTATGKAFFEDDQVLFFPLVRQDILPGERGYRGD